MKTVSQSALYVTLASSVLCTPFHGPEFVPTPLSEQRKNMLSMCVRGTKVLWPSTRQQELSPDKLLLLYTLFISCLDLDNFCV